MKTTRELFDEATARAKLAREVLKDVKGVKESSRAIRDLIDALTALADATDAHVAWLDEQNASHKGN